MTHPSPRVLALAGCLAAAGALAQEDPVRTLPEVTVIHRTPLPGLDVPQSQYPGNAQQATDGTIEQAGAGSLTEFMSRRLVAVTSNDVQGGSPFQAEITYRGQRLSPLLGSAQGLSLYLDGVRMNQPFGDVVNWELLPEAAIAGLALVPGSNPLYGLNTLAGALVLTTKSGLTHAGTEAEISLGSAGRRRIDFGHGVQWGEGWHGYVAGTAFQENGWRDESPSRFGNLFLKLGRQQGGGLDWTLSLLHGQSRLVGNGLVTESLLAANRNAIYTSPDITEARDSLLSFQATQALADDAKLVLLAWHRRGGRDTSTGDVSEAWGDWLESCEGDAGAPRCSDPSDPGYVGPAAVINRSRSRQQETGAALQWTRRFGAHQVALGTEAAVARTQHDQFTSDGVFDASRAAVDAGPETQEISLRGHSQRFALFGADVIELSSRTQLTAAARWDQTRVRNALGQPEPTGDESFRYAKLNPSLGLNHAISETFGAFASASQGTRVPTALELGCADAAQPCVLPTGLQADPYLKQVVSRTLEAGVRWRPATGLLVSGALFRTDNRDDIVFVRSGVSQAGYFTNIDRTRRQGVELAASRRQPGFDWSLGYTYLQATYQSEGVLPGPLSTDSQPNTFRPGTPIAGLPRHVLNVAADWRALPRLTLGMDWQLVGSRVVSGNESGDQPELGRIAGYGVVHVRARWQVDERWQAFFRVNNLFDRRYATAGAGNLDLFPAGQPVLPPGEPAAARFVAPGAPRMFMVGVRYEWDRP